MFTPITVELASSRRECRGPCVRRGQAGNRAQALRPVPGSQSEGTFSTGAVRGGVPGVAREGEWCGPSPNKGTVEVFARKAHDHSSSKVHTGFARPTVAWRGIGPE